MVHDDSSHKSGEQKVLHTSMYYNKYIVNFCAACGGKLNFARNT